MIPRATIDFETKSTCDLRKFGSWRYSLDPTTQVLCLAYHVPGWDADRVGLWHPPLPHLLLDEADDPDIFDLIEWIGVGGLIEAHNAWFERGIWTNILVPRYGFPPVPHRQWRCSAAKAAALALPRSLGDAVAALHLAVQKDADGHALMLKVSKPRKALKAETQEWANEHGTGVCTQCKGKGTYKRKPCAKCEGAGMLGDEDAPALPTLWHETAEQIADLWEYCKTDVRAEHGLSLALPDLNAAETEMYLLDQRINERGFQLDTDAVAAALKLIAEETVDLNTQLADVTGGVVTKATQRARMSAWFAEQGLELPNTQGATIDDALKTATDPAITRALTIVRELGRSSTAKYQTMQRWVCPDGRVRGGLLYHGATTGRWSGAGVQPHNFVRGTIKDQVALWNVLKTGDREVIRATYGSVMLALANALRGAICAAPGRQLYVADYAQIEARVILWLAGDEAGLDLFRSGADIYSDMATSIYGRPINKHDNPDERQLGKAAILGCLGADSLVLTMRGWVPILLVTTTDYLWDGIEWVTHHGVIYQGDQSTIMRKGLSLTPGHSILCGNQWLPAAVALAAPEISRALATGSASLPLSATFGAPVVRPAALSRNVPVVDPFIASRNTTYEKARRLDAAPVPALPLDTGGNGIGDMPTWWLTTNTEGGYLTASAPLSIGAATPAMRGSSITAGAELSSTPSGWIIVERFWRIWSRWTAGIARRWNWIVGTTTRATSLATCVSSVEKSTWAIDDLSDACKPESIALKPVYDIANAGPRHRFTVWTTAGPVIVHNCGFQMGWKRFIESAWTLGQVVIDEAMARQTVDAYRAKYWRIVDLWSDQELAAIDATNTWKAQRCGHVTWLRDTRFLFCELPSGRRLAYPYPEVQQRQTSWGEWKMTLTFEGVEPFTRQWRRQATYGGMIVENLVQATARDVMADAMLRCEATGVYEPVLSVHDELVAEADEGKGSVEEFEQLLSTVPTWARGCPIVAEGYSTTRYRK